MNKLKIQVMGLLLTVLYSNNIQASDTGFDGTELVGAVYCCTVNDRISEPATFIVSSDEVEFGAIEDAGENVVGASIDINYKVDTRTAGGLFNGYILNFSPINPDPRIPGEEGVPLPDIESISLNSESSFDSSQIGLSFDTDTIRINLSNLRITVGSRILIDVVFIEPPPSPYVNIPVACKN